MCKRPRLERGLLGASTCHCEDCYPSLTSTTSASFPSAPPPSSTAFKDMAPHTGHVPFENMAGPPRRSLYEKFPTSEAHHSLTSIFHAGVSRNLVDNTCASVSSSSSSAFFSSSVTNTSASLYCHGGATAVPLDHDAESSQHSICHRVPRLEEEPEVGSPPRATHTSHGSAFVGQEVAPHIEQTGPFFAFQAAPTLARSSSDAAPRRYRPRAIRWAQQALLSRMQSALPAIQSTQAASLTSHPSPLQDLPESTSPLLGQRMQALELSTPHVSSIQSSSSHVAAPELETPPNLAQVENHSGSTFPEASQGSFQVKKATWAPPAAEMPPMGDLEDLGRSNSEAKVYCASVCSSESCRSERGPPQEAGGVGMVVRSRVGRKRPRSAAVQQQKQQQQQQQQPTQHQQQESAANRFAASALLSF